MPVITLPDGSKRQYENALSVYDIALSIGEGLAKGSAEIRNNKEGPDTHNYASWEKYVVIRDNYNRHLAQLEEIEKRL